MVVIKYDLGVEKGSSIIGHALCSEIDSGVLLVEMIEKVVYL